MIETSASTLARELHEFLSRVEHGETVRIRKHGRAVARLVPDCEFMTGKRTAEIFRSHKANPQDREAADAVQAEIQRLDKEQNDALDSLKTDF